jgi:hypothetical protein
MAKEAILKLPENQCAAPFRYLHYGQVLDRIRERNTVFTRNHQPQPTRRTGNAGSPSAAQIQAAMATLQALVPTMPTPSRPVAGHRIPPTPSPKAFQDTAWERIGNATVYLCDPRICPVPLPMRATNGLTATANGNPAKRFVADGFVGRDGRPVGCLVVPNFADGTPMVIWGDGAPTSSFKVKG